MAASFLYSSTNSAICTYKTTKFHRRSSSYRPMKITPKTRIASSLATINNDVDVHIQQALSGPKEPAAVYEPMHHLIFDAPRNLAPALCIAACEAVGGEKAQAIGAASALHLMQAAAFTHENLLLSKTTPNISFGANIRLLTGDGILSLGYELLTKLDDSVKQNSGHILKVVLEITRAMGPQGMVEGQYEEIKSFGSDEDDDDETFAVGWMDRVCKKKEGGMYACAAACGAILGGGSDEEIETLRRYGLYLGLIHGIRIYQTGTEETVHKFRTLALNELESLQLKNVEAIQKLMDESSATTEM